MTASLPKPSDSFVGESPREVSGTKRDRQKIPKRKIKSCNTIQNHQTNALR